MCNFSNLVTKGEILIGGPNYFQGVPKSCHSITIFYIFYPIFFYYVKTHLWMTMMESGIVVVKNMVLLKYLTTFDSLFFMGIKI